MIEAQKAAYFKEKSMNGKDHENNEIAEDDATEHYESPQIFVRQLFKLYDKGLVDDQNIRDQVFLMV